MAGNPSSTENFELRNEFGNAEANLRFLSTPGILPRGARILEIGTGRGRPR